MNERIRQLAEQAGLKWKAQPPHYTNTNNPIDFPVSANHDLEKFAELIVWECIDTLSKRFMGDLNREDMEIRRCIEDVKKCFGVE